MWGSDTDPSLTDGYFSITRNTAHEQYSNVAVGPDVPPPQAPFMRWDGPLPVHPGQVFTPALGSVDNGVGLTGPIDGVFAGSGRSGLGQAYGRQANYEEGTWGSLYLPTPSHMGAAPATYSQLSRSIRARADKYNHDTSRVAIPAVFAPVNATNYYGGYGSST